MGAQMNVQERTASRLPMASPRRRSLAVTPWRTKKAPITNSVAATCSPANRPANLAPDWSLSGVTGSRSNS